MSHMKNFRYLENVATLKYDENLCIGCGMCAAVCPHGVFEMHEKSARVRDLDGCMECGACAMNCPVSAIAVDAGVGCASGIINEWLASKKLRKESTCC